MRNQLALLTVLGAALLVSGCENRTLGGAAIGGGIGAGTGAIIGSQSGHAGTGALIGAGIGALAGGIIGHAIDDSQRSYLARGYPETLSRVDQGAPLSPYDIIALTRAGVSDDVILSQMRQSRTIYQLSPQQIIDLRNNGVSNRVINAMINSSELQGNYYQDSGYHRGPDYYPERSVRTDVRYYGH